MKSLSQAEFKYETEAFLSNFPGRHLFVTIGEGPTKSLPSDYGRIEKALHRDNSAGRDIYFTVSECKPGSKRTKDEYIRTRAVWLDDDGDKHGRTTPDDFPLEPNIVVQSSPGKYHYYWLTSCEDADATEAVNRGIAEIYHGDPAVWDCTRILRLPGFLHNKSGTTSSFTVLRREPYDWDEILTNFPPALAPVKELEIRKSKFDFSKAFDDIITGENIHESRRGIALHWANIGLPREEALAMLNSFILKGVELGNIDRERGRERLENMAGSVNDAYTKVADERKGEVINLFDSGRQDPYTRLTRPPGALAEFADDVMQYMPFPSWEMALIEAMHCVTTFGGGLYRIGTKMGVRPRVVLAETGRGKDVAKRYFEDVMRHLMQGTTHLHIPDFRGSTSHTPSMIHKELSRFRMRSIIQTEAGIAGKSKAGDMHNLRAYLLSAASNNYKSPLTIKQFSDRENGKANEELKPLYAALPVILMESTPAPYVELLQKEDAFRSGEVGRQELIFVDPYKPPMNTNAEGAIDPKVIQAYKLLANNTLESGRLTGDDLSTPDFIKPIDISQIELSLQAYSTESTNQYNAATLDNNYVQLAMASRAYERVIVTILVQAIADMAYNGESLPVATRGHFDWAVEYQEELTRSLIAQTSSGSLADPLSLCVERVNSRRLDFGEKSYDKHAPNNIIDRHVGRSWITKVLDRSKFRPFDELTRMNFNKRDQAMQAVIKYCEDLNLLNRLPPKGGREIWRLAE